jgi:hypothetical protein
LVSQVKAYHYQDYPDGNPNLGHIMEMMEIRFAAKRQARLMGHHLQQAIS